MRSPHLRERWYWNVFCFAKGWADSPCATPALATDKLVVLSNDPQQIQVTHDVGNP